MDKNDLEIVVSARDEASDTLKKIGQSTEGMATSVFKGVAAWDLFKAGVKAVGSIIEDTVEEFVSAQRNIDLTRATVESMGVSFDSVRDQLTTFGSTLSAVSVDNDQAALAASKLAKMAGGDLKAGMELAKKAADLTASGYGDFASNVDNLTRILSGKGARALMEYRVNLDDNATTAEQLDAVFKKITLTTEGMGDTIPGQVNEFKTAFEEAKQTIGQGFMVAMLNAIETNGKFADSLNLIRDAAKGVAVAVNEAANIIGVLKHTGETAVGVPTVGLLSVLNGVGIVSDQHLKNAVDSVKHSSDQLGESFNNTMHPIDSYNAQVKKVEEQTKATTKAQDDYKSTLDKIANANKTSESTFVKHADAIKQLKTEYTQMKDEASRALAEMSDTFQSDMQSINNSISKTQQEITNLQNSFNQQAVSDAASVADKIVASEQKIRDLKVQIANETDTMKRSQLQKQLDDEQANYNSSADFRANNAQAITEAERRAGLTDMQRTIEDYNARRALAVQEFNQKMTDLQQTLTQEIQKKQQTIELYNARRKEINDILTQGNTDFKKLSDERVATTKAEVDQEIKYFQALQSAISAAKSASSSAVSISSIPVAPRASGGPVSPNTPYIVGEEGPELMIPGTNGTIIPNDKLGGGSSINVYLSGTFYTETDMAERLGNQLASIIGQQLKIRTI